MATITTKFSIGDTVYFATTIQVRKQHPCPDCLGSKKWAAKSPAGKDYQFACPRCSTAYMSDRDLSLEYTDVAPGAVKLTIGQLRAVSPSDDDGNQWDGKNQYMCRETGIGSGQVYDERRLFETEEQALASAAVLAKEQKKNVPWIGELFNKALKISDYEINDAKVHEAQESQSRFEWRVRDMLDAISYSDTVDEIKEAVAKWREEQS